MSDVCGTIVIGLTRMMDSELAVGSVDDRKGETERKVTVDWSGLHRVAP